ncbi:hypothetical protein L2E82_11835 [Cichorium intybus]|nr:hypothetical protein L2E82_11835 [Cichorium intybus]
MVSSVLPACRRLNLTIKVQIVTKNTGGSSGILFSLASFVEFAIRLTITISPVLESIPKQTHMPLADTDESGSVVGLRLIPQSGYEKMTVVQAATLPVILKGKDVLAKARTGTGKQFEQR